MVSLNVGAMAETTGKTVVTNIASLYTGTVKTTPGSIAFTTKYHGAWPGSVQFRSVQFSSVQI